MSIEVFSGTSIPRELATAAMEYLWAKWKTLHDTGNLTMQRLTEDSSYPLRANSLHLLNVDDDFVYLHVGDAIQAAASENLIGSRLMDQLKNPLRHEFANIYRQVVDRFAPVLVRFTASWSQSGKLWQRLVLPVKATDSTAMLLVYSELISYEREVYEYLFRTARDALIVASPVDNDAGHTIDGWVMMMNDRARELLRFEGSIGNLRLRQLPPFAHIDSWDRLYAPNAAAAPVLAADFNVELIRFPHVFGLKIEPKTVDGSEASLVPSDNLSQPVGSPS